MPVKTQEELKMLSPEQRKEYDKQLNRERVNRYRQANKDTEEYKLKKYLILKDKVHMPIYLSIMNKLQWLVH
jgi:hypothetical protein